VVPLFYQKQHNISETGQDTTIVRENVRNTAKNVKNVFSNYGYDQGHYWRSTATVVHNIQLL